jgi:hypothetical protein
MFILNVVFVKAIGIPNGYMGSAWASLVSYFAVMVLSYFVGRHYYPLPYQLGRIGLYTLFAAILYIAGTWIGSVCSLTVTYLLRILLLCVYLCVVAYNEPVPVLSRLLHRK